jgi:uncharacterized protein
MADKFRDFQREWLAERNACGCDTQCLQDSYNKQIKSLTSTMERR